MYSPKSLSIKNIISYQDSTYNFNNNSATIIVGNNLDNSSQKVNGAGKSGFIEALALAFTGSSIRDVKTKELVRRGEKSGEVELILSNSQTKKDLKIWRRIHNGTKSAECRIWLGDEEVRLPDINSYNSFVFETIDLSKEDFFNFYLLTQANYSPFLRVGDTKKKEIINRFSGADIIDNCLPLVKEDVQKFDQQIQESKKSLMEVEMKKEFLQQQLQELIEKDSRVQEEIQSLIDIEMQGKESSEKLMNQYKKEIEELESKIENLKSTLSDEENQAAKREFQEIREKLNNDKKIIENSFKDLEEQKGDINQSYQPQYKEIESQELEVKELIKNSEQMLRDEKKKCNHLSHQLLGKIDCPHCHQSFLVEGELSYEEIVKQEGFSKENIKELENQITDLQILQDELKVQRKEIDEKVDQDQQRIREELQELQQQQDEINKLINQNQKQIDDLIEREDEINKEIVRIDRNRTKLHEDYTRQASAAAHYDVRIENHKKLSYQEEIDVKKAQINTFASTIEDRIKENDDLNQQYQAIAEWEQNFKSFKSFVANQSIKNIEDYVNIFLKQMGSDLGIVLSGYSTLSTGKIKEQISVEVKRRGFEEGSYGSFSGGERGRIDICTILAIQQLINLNCKGGGLDLLICDEILDQIDVLGLESIVESLQNLSRTIMIVSQNEINSLKEHTLMIEKKDKISRFVN